MKLKTGKQQRETKTQFFEKENKADKPPAKLMKRQIKIKEKI